MAAGRAADRGPDHGRLMDPLALPLSCPCVKGHAQASLRQTGIVPGKAARSAREGAVFRRPVESGSQRDEEHRHRSSASGRWSSSTPRSARWPFAPAMMLAGKDGKTTLNGLIVVRKDDPAQKLARSQRLQDPFRSPGVRREIQGGCRDPAKGGRSLAGQSSKRGPVAAIRWSRCWRTPTSRSAAVISSYAAALLEGCGTIEKGSIRVVGQTRPVPFVTVFYTDRLDRATAAQVGKAIGRGQGESGFGNRASRRPPALSPWKKRQRRSADDKGAEKRQRAKKN